ncbi:MAG: hypothetical protein ACOX37_09875 [Bacillota bacterium]
MPGGENPRTSRPNCPGLQLAILQWSCFCFKVPGGVLVYSTCSLAEEENEEVVKEFLACQRSFLSGGFNRVLPCSWQREEDLQFRSGGGYWQVLPHGAWYRWFFPRSFPEKELGRNFAGRGPQGLFWYDNTFSCLIIGTGRGGEDQVGVVAPSTGRFFSAPGWKAGLERSFPVQ